MVFAEIDGVRYVLPDARSDPPVDDAYQLKVLPAEPAAVKDTVPVPQREAGVVETTAGSLTPIATVFESVNPPFAHVTLTK